VSRPQFVVYSRQGCHLCEQLIEELLPLIRDRASLTVQDIDESEALVLTYGIRVPVLALDGQEICQYHLDRPAVLAALEHA